MRAARIPHRALPLDQLRAFEAVARRLSFRGAAEALALTQPAISRQIQALEAQLGARLFLRGSRRVELTAAGLRLQAACTPALERIDRAVHEIRRGLARRQVNVTTFASLGTLWLLPRLARFQAQHPDIDIRISTTERAEALDDPDLDVALRMFMRDELGQLADLPGELLFDEQLTPVASPWLLAQTPLKTLDDLARVAWLDADPVETTDHAWSDWLAAQGRADILPPRRIQLAFFLQQTQAAIAGQGVALGRLSLALDPLQRGELVEPFGHAGRLAVPVSQRMLLATHEAARRPEVQAFVAWVAAEAAATREGMRSMPDAGGDVVIGGNGLAA